VKSLRLVACVIVLAACQGTPAEPSPAATPLGPPVQTQSPASSPTPGTSPATSPGTIRWSTYTSEIKSFSLQLPTEWTVQAGIPAEDILLQLGGGSDGRGLISEDFPPRAETFQSYVDRYYDRVIREDPSAVQVLSHDSGRVARAVIRTGDVVSVDYLYQPSGGSAKLLSFGWERPDPNPLWDLIAQRFNPHSSELIIPFATPSPGG
jgi:hypothetical protein